MLISAQILQAAAKRSSRWGTGGWKRGVKNREKKKGGGDYTDFAQDFIHAFKASSALC